MNDGKYVIPRELRSEKLQGRSAYSSYDYKPLKCKIDGEMAEVTVGDQPEHKTHINLRDGSLYYHDPDDPTNHGVQALFSSIGLRCTVHAFRGVECKGVTEAKVIMLFRALGMVPSMDRRLEFCREEHPASFCIEKELAFFRGGARKE